MHFLFGAEVESGKRSAFSTKQKDHHDPSGSVPRLTLTRTPASLASKTAGDTKGCRMVS